MNDVGWIFTISMFWILLIVGTTALAADTSLNQLYSIDENFTYSAGNINFTSSEAAEVSVLGFLDIVQILFAFSVPTASNMPPLLALFISSLNWLIILLLFLLLYRQFRSGGG